jgi:hypothetical protein
VIRLTRLGVLDSQKLARRSLELMAEKVMPAVNKAIAPRQPVA